MTALMEIVADDGSYPEVLWTFNRPSTAETDGVISRLEPGLNRGRVTLYKSIDCQQFFPKLQQTWEGIDPSHQRAATRSSPVVFAVIPARPDFPSDTRMQDQEEEDRPPFVEICVGRDQDLQRLNSSDATVVFLTGLGGQGKSTIAAFYFNQSTTIAKYSTRLWRDCKEESERFENQLAAAVQTLSHGKVSAADLARQSAGSIIALLMSLIKDRSVLLVFDNVDHYVELEAEQLVGAADALIRGMLQSGTRSRVVFTCRPSVIYGHPLAMSDRLAGLTLEASYELFTQRRAPSSREEISDAHELTDGHAFWLDLLAVQVAKRAPDVSLGSLVAEIRTGGGHCPDKTLRSIWETLPKREQTVLRAMAETVKPDTVDEIAEYLGHEIRYDKVAKAIRALRASNLVVINCRENAPDLLELHPLVRQFIRQHFSPRERVTFIDRIISIYLAVVGASRQQLSQRPPLSILQRWSQIAELYIAANKIQEAFAHLAEVADAFQSSPFSREFCRVTRMLLNRFDWISDHYKFKFFEKVFAVNVNLLSHLGEYSEAERLLGEFERTVPNRDARYIQYCGMQCEYHWIKGDFATAAQWGRTGKKLKDSGVDTRYEIAGTLALAERDSGHPEVALETFLQGQPLATVVNPASIDQERAGYYYGNIGRCLQFMGQTDSALVCYRKSALLIERRESGQTVLNQGYIRYWIGEVLLARGQRELAKTFLLAAYAKWRHVSPPKAEKVRTLSEQLGGVNARDHEAEERKAETVCLEWIYGQQVDERVSSAAHL